MDGRRRFVAAYRHRTQLSTSQVSYFVIGMHIDNVVSCLITMVCNVNFAGIYAILLHHIIHAIPTNIILTALFAPYLKRHIVDAALCIRHTGAYGKYALCRVRCDVHGVEDRPLLVNVYRKLLDGSACQIHGIVIAMHPYGIGAQLVVMVGQIHLARPYAVCIQICAVPMYVVLAAGIAPYLKRYIINAGYVIRNIRNGHLKLFGIYRLSSLNFELGNIQMRGIVIHNSPSAGIYRDKLRFVIVKCQDLLIALAVSGPLLRAALAHPYAMAIAPGHQIPARDLSAGFYLFHAAHSQLFVEKSMVFIDILAFALFQQRQRALYTILGDHAAAVIQIAHVDHRRCRSIAAAAGAGPLLRTVFDALHADQLYVVLAGYIAAAQRIVHRFLQRIQLAAGIGVWEIPAAPVVLLGGKLLADIGIFPIIQNDVPVARLPYIGKAGAAVYLCQDIRVV